MWASERERGERERERESGPGSWKQSPLLILTLRSPSWDPALDHSLEVTTASAKEATTSGGKCNVGLQAASSN